MNQIKHSYVSVYFFLLVLFVGVGFGQYYSLHRTMTGHTGWVWSLSYSPDGNLIASGAADHTVKIWDVSMGICIRTLRGHALDVYTVSFSPDGKFIASGSEDNTVRIWNAATGECLNVLKGHKSWVHAVAFSPDGRLVASASGDETCRIWDVDSGISIKTLSGHTGSVWAVTFSPDGKKIITGSSDRTAKYWDIKTGECIKTLSGHNGAVRSVAFNPSGALIASGSCDNTIIIWRVETGENIKILKGHSGWVEAVGFTPDGMKLISTSDDKSIRVWSISKGVCTQVLQEHKREVLSFAINRRGTKFTTGSCDCKIDIWRRSRLYGYTSYYKLRIDDKVYEAVEVEYPGEPRGKVVMDQEGSPVKDKEILARVLNAGDVIGFYKDPEYRKERFKYFIGNEVEPKKAVFSMFIDEIPDNELMQWWRSEKYASKTLSATKASFLIGSEMAKKIELEVPKEYAELAIEKFSKDPVIFFATLCKDVIFDGMQKLLSLEIMCDAVRKKEIIDIKEYEQIEDSFWDAVVYASAMNYTYSKMEAELAVDITSTMKKNFNELMVLLKVDKPIEVSEIGIKFGEILSQTKVYEEYHKEIKKRWKLKQRDVAERQKKERIEKASYLADKIARGL